MASSPVQAVPLQHVAVQGLDVQAVPLQHAAVQGLDVQGASLYHADAEGRTALHHAVTGGSVSVMEVSKHVKQSCYMLTCTYDRPNGHFVGCQRVLATNFLLWIEKSSPLVSV